MSIVKDFFDTLSGKYSSIDTVDIEDVALREGVNADNRKILIEATKKAFNSKIDKSSKVEKERKQPNFNYNTLEKMRQVNGQKELNKRETKSNIGGRDDI